MQILRGEYLFPPPPAEGGRRLQAMLLSMMMTMMSNSRVEKIVKRGVKEDKEIGIRTDGDG